MHCSLMDDEWSYWKYIFGYQTDIKYFQNYLKSIFGYKYVFLVYRKDLMKIYQKAKKYSKLYYE